VIVVADLSTQLEAVRDLFREYARSLAFDLAFQDFGSELAGLPGDYAPPTGRLLVAQHGGQLAGCVALRRLDAFTCEMKRLFVRPMFRGKGLGRELAVSILRDAKEIGYRRMRLDTVGSMKEAIGLYRDLGFRVTAPYRHNPIADALFFELDLTAALPDEDMRPTRGEP